VTKIERLQDFVEKVDIYEVDWMVLKVDGNYLRISNTNFFEMLADDVDSMTGLRGWDSTRRRLENIGLIEPSIDGHYRATAKLHNLLPVLNAALKNNLVLAEVADGEVAI
jgi:hypothetical protein